MEEIKTSIEKIFEQFSENAKSYKVPKRLSYSSLYDSIPTADSSVSKKRKLSLENVANISFNDQSAISVNDESTTDKNSTFNSSSIWNSTGGSLIPPPNAWEIRRMKADVIDANAKAIEYKREIEKRINVYNQMESIYITKVNGLQKQVDTSTEKLKEADKQVKHYRKKEAAAQMELTKTKNQLRQQKESSDETINQLQREKQDVEKQLRETYSDLMGQITELNNQYNEMERNYVYVRDELDTIQENTTQLQKKGEKYNELDAEFQIQKNQLDVARRRVEELETEVKAFGNWKELSKTFHGRMAKIPDLEKELERLRRDNKNLHATIGNKLLLEEEVLDLKSRLEKYERSHENNIALQTHKTALEAELKQYKAIAMDHCPPNTATNAVNLRIHIEGILQRDLVLQSEKGTTRNEKQCASLQVQDLQRKVESCSKRNGELETLLKQHKISLNVIKKRLTLIGKERDCYKQLIENYEKDLTINPSTELNPDSQIRLKMDMLERSMLGYKELCATLEKDLQTCKNLPDLSLNTANNNENYERFKKDLDVLRQDNERLRKRKEELELIVEQLSLKGAYNIDQFKVLHMELNPTSEAHKNHKNEMEKLQAEIERLKRKNLKLQKDHEDMTARLNLNETDTTQKVIEENTLRERLTAAENKYKHLKEIYKTAGNDFRHVCYLLFGYRVDRVDQHNYRVTSMFAEAENEYLHFRLGESDGLDMLETNYSISLAELMLSLAEHNSLPVFLSTLTLELFNRTTMA